MRSRRILPAGLRRFGRSDRGAAAVEFALILPFLLTLYLGSVELSSLITVDRRVAVISGTVGDLVARWDPEDNAIPMATLTDYFRASEGIIFPYDSATLKQVVSVVRVFADNTTQVQWSCGYNGGTKHATNSSYELPENLRNLVKNSSGYVVASETWYDYTPVLGIEFSDLYNLYTESFYLPRFEENIAGPAC
jgi:Flp pilus assembly protein TadG